MRCLASLLPAAALLAACSSPPPPQTTVITTPPPPIVTGALGAPPSAAPLSGSSLAPVPPIAGSPRLVPRPLTPSETMAALTGNTAIGTTATGVPYQLYFTADGRERFRQGNFADAGTWRVLPDGQLCMRMPQVSNNAEECYLLAQYGNLVLYQRPDGLEQGSLRIVPGNPHGI
jgi:hypothetical protein